MSQIIFLVALDKNNLMGCNNDIPWHYSEDLKRFKSLTLGYPVVMGRRTWESLTTQPLPKRPNVVLTRDLNYCTNDKAFVFSNLDDVLLRFKEYGKIFVIGGAEIFKAYLSYADVLNITKINATFSGDVYWDDLDLSIWELQSNEISGILDFRIYTRKETS